MRSKYKKKKFRLHRYYRILCKKSQLSSNKIDRKVSKIQPECCIDRVVRYSISHQGKKPSEVAAKYDDMLRYRSTFGYNPTSLRV